MIVCPAGRDGLFTRRSQILLVALDHLLDHLAADGAGLAGSEVAVVALLQVDADFGSGFQNNICVQNTR